MGGSDASISVEESIPGVADALAARRSQPGLRYFNYKGDRALVGMRHHGQHATPVQVQTQ